MREANDRPGRLRFGIFEADLRAGELTKHGVRLRLQEQPFQLLAMLLEKPGELVTREELRNRLWPGTVVDFDHGVNKAISKIREALGDSAENPRFVETVARRGYRFLADVAAIDTAPDRQPEAAPDRLVRPRDPGLVGLTDALTSSNRPPRPIALGRFSLGSNDVLSFGPFRLSVAERLLEKKGAPIQLGGRALDILLVLIEHASEVVSKKDLMASVWQDVTVNDGSLRFHISALRKALGDGESGARYVTNVPGRGYCFVAPIFRSNAPKPLPIKDLVFDHRLPARLTRMIGREEAIHTISAQLAAQRFVTIVGSGGIGKTTLAVSVCHTLLAEFDGFVRFVDLGLLSDPLLVSSAVASTCELLVQSVDPIPGLITFLRDTRMLLVIDGCEHVIEAAAALAERIFEEAPHVHILATSRESLRVEGEFVHRLTPLDCPPDDAGLTVAEALVFPAVQLFVERVAASGNRFELSDADAPTVAEICRKLDGMALAIELAASRVEAYGIQGTKALLDSRLRLLWKGRRTAPPRHQTLNATFDWSYNLLPEVERRILNRLSVFAGVFTLEAAQAVAAGEDIDGAQVVEAVGRLVAKSLATADARAATMRCRLLDTTRVYVQRKLIESGEADAVARRQATYYCEFLENTGANVAALSKAEAFALYGELVANVRSALEWCFSQRGDTGVGTTLAAASAPLFLEMSLLTECHGWAVRAITALDETSRGTRREMELQTALGLSLMFTKGNSEEVRTALARGLQIAESLKDLFHQLRLLGGLNVFLNRIGDFRGALLLAQRSEAVAKEMGDPVSMATAVCMLGTSHHFMGNQANAQPLCEVALTLPPPSQRINAIHFGVDQRIRALCALAKTLWLRGYSDQAVRVARHTIEEAETLEQPVTLCISLMGTGPVFLWIGDWPSAQEISQRLIAHAEKHSLAPCHAVGVALKGELAVRRGEAEAGVQLLRGCLEELLVDRYQSRSTVFLSVLAEGLAMTGQLDEAVTTIDEAAILVERNGDSFYMPEILRIKGDILASARPMDEAEIEECFSRSLAWASRQSAMSLELRTAMSLARLWHRQGRLDEARSLLSSVYDRFTEGFEAADLKAAMRLLDELDRRANPG
jgi:predicted ATPase/DNA-binding winged helix-turn-helix (wHTH) protein